MPLVSAVPLLLIDVDGVLNPHVRPGTTLTPGTPVASRAFLNNGDGTFTDATEAVLATSSSSRP